MIRVFPRRTIAAVSTSAALAAALLLVLPARSSKAQEEVPPPRPERLPAAEQAPAVEERCGMESPAESDRSAAAGPYRSERVSFTVQFQDEVNPYRVMSLFAMPGEEVEIEALLTDREARFEACANGGELIRRGEERWSWRAPSRPGWYRLEVTDRVAGESMRLNAAVLRPYDGEPELEGYRIGRYQRLPLRNDPAYEMPSGMVRVEAGEVDTWVSPHFQLHQFLCKQAGDYPKFLVVRTRMLLKLETLLDRVNDRGIEADTFAVLSGYRTPWYNASIGNTTSYSRHAYCDAADIYVDRDGDGRMDDLDGDGRSDRGDARVIYDLVETSVEQAWYRPFVGGMGLYGPKPHRGPFVHVDTRGFRARW